MKKQELKTPRTINWSHIKSLIITALIVGVTAFISGYFVSINIHEDARGQVVSDMQVVKQSAR